MIDNDDLRDLAFELVQSHLTDSFEYLTVAETLQEEFEEATDEDIEFVYDLVQSTLKNLSETFNLKESK